VLKVSDWLIGALDDIFWLYVDTDALFYERYHVSIVVSLSGIYINTEK
jgi:hypothetical protein